MAMAVVYATVNGRLVQESRGGTVTRYVSDTLGSCVQTRDSAGNVTSTTEYWPYGEVRTSTGTNPSPWGFVGLLGYFTDTVSRLYVRMRHYRPGITRWQTVDPLWPAEEPYQYCRAEPPSSVDPAGSMPILALAALVAAGVLTCALAALMLFDHYAHRVYRYPLDHIGHCVANCILSTYLPPCGMIAILGTECVGEKDPGDINANAFGYGLGLLNPLRLQPQAAIAYCNHMCILSYKLGRI